MYGDAERVEPWTQHTTSGCSSAEGQTVCGRLDRKFLNHRVAETPFKDFNLMWKIGIDVSDQNFHFCCGPVGLWLVSGPAS